MSHRIEVIDQQFLAIQPATRHDVEGIEIATDGVVLFITGNLDGLVARVQAAVDLSADSDARAI